MTTPDSDLGRDLDQAWDDSDIAEDTRAAAPSTRVPELAELDNGWDLEAGPGPMPGARTGRGPGGNLRSLTKKERKELERKKRAQAAQREADRLRERKLLRQKEARERSERRESEQRTTRVAGRAKEKPPRRSVGQKSAEHGRVSVEAPAASRVREYPARSVQVADAKRAVGPSSKAPGRSGAPRALRILFGVLAALTLLFVIVSVFQR